MKYSLIIPHFDDAKRLERLLCSLPIDRVDLEIIVIDDCSPDQSNIEKLSKQWPSVRWLSTRENAGAGVARNVGLDAAKGRWLVFGDSDDEFLPDAFNAFDRLLRPDDQLVYFLAEAVQESDGSPSVRSDRINALVTDCARSPNEDNVRRLKLQHVNPVAKVYSRAFIRELELRFDPTRRSNDVAFNVLAALQAENLRAETTLVYRVYRREGSLTTDTTTDGLLARLEVIGNLNDRIKDLGLSERMHAASFLARSFRLGPSAVLATFRLMLRHEMLLATVRRLDPREVLRFVRWANRSRRERQQMGAKSGNNSGRGAAPYSRDGGAE